MFADRKEAGKQLAKRLDQYFAALPGLDRQAHLIVVGLARGGVPVAFEVARRLACPLEVIVAKKLPYPGQNEYAIGAVSSTGIVVLSPDVPRNFQWRAYIDQQHHKLLDLTSQSEQQFYSQAGRKQASFAGKTIIVVDDGVATGMTALAGLETVRRLGADIVIMAAPIVSPLTHKQLQAHCDEVIALSMPFNFSSVGQFYLDFGQTSSAEVVSLLRESAKFAPVLAQPISALDKSDSPGPEIYKCT
ncbi:MAG: phosphoribosyltransferase family protein [Candidatus Obscuribacterales bacterium]|nr:phosphoribosyltransferase family protein [Candidatus Obscuribacterales bacterium]